MTFTDTGTVQTNAQVENSYYNDSSSAHMEPMTGAQFSVGDWNSVTDTGVTYDFIVEPKLIGLRFDSYQGVQEGSPIVGYLISMQSTQGAAAYFFFPTADQDLSQMNMPYPNGQTEPAGYTYSEITHYDSLDNLDGDPQANVTYVAYSDLYDGFPSHFTGAVCYGAGTRLRGIKTTAAISPIKADQYRPWRGLRETLPQIRQSGLLQSPDAWFPSALGNNAGYAMSATSS